MPLAGGRSHRKYAVKALATAGNSGNSMSTLVLGLRTLSTPARQSRSSSRSERISAAPSPYVARGASQSRVCPSGPNAELREECVLHHAMAEFVAALRMRESVAP
jgi:hypothetical protein